MCNSESGVVHASAETLGLLIAWSSASRFSCGSVSSTRRAVSPTVSRPASVSKSTTCPLRYLYVADVYPQREKTLTDVYYLCSSKRLLCETPKHINVNLCM